MTTFAMRLKQLREKAGISQAELAKRAGLNSFGVAKLEQGVREPALSTAQAIARALGESMTVFDDVSFADEGAPTEEASPAKLGRPRKPDAPPAAPPAKKGRARKSDSKSSQGER